MLNVRMRAVPEADNEDRMTEDVQACRNLWALVMRIAVEDAQIDLSEVNPHSAEYARLRSDRDRARRFFDPKSETSMLGEYCEMLDLNKGQVLTRMKALMQRFVAVEPRPIAAPL